jgi:tetratricopeptide (TPR) repeat protein
MLDRIPARQNAVHAMMKLSNNKKRKIGEILEQAKGALAAGRIPMFDELCRRIESVQQGNPDVANLRAIVRYKMGQPAEAEKLFLAAIKTAPGRQEFHNNLGALYLDQQRYAQAADCYSQAIKLGNKALPVQLSYSKALVEIGRSEDAVAVLQRLKKQYPRDTDVLMGLYAAHYRLDQISEARACLEAILEQHPDHAEALYELGMLDNQAGRLEQGESGLRASLSIKPGNASAYAALAGLKRFEADDDADLVAMTELYERSGTNTDERIGLSFALGKAMEDMKQYDRAFAYFAEGNGLYRKRSRYDVNDSLAHMQQAIDTFTAQMFANASDIDDATPVFIVGMPRCGSTLVEQILAAHPDVTSRGECEFFASKALHAFHSDDVPLTPERMAAFTPKQWGEIGRIYLQHLRGDDTAALRITDKTLTYIRQIGAIHCALPKAKIVHVRRHPLDTCLSIYKHYLQGHRFDYGYDLDDLGNYYRMYLKLMQHWRDVLPKGAMVELDYEDLVADQEGETRKLLDACGLPWNEACLQFNKATNVVRTASMAQVRRPIYTDSQAAWKRYKKQLKPLINILGTKYPKIR